MRIDDFMPLYDIRMKHRELASASAGTIYSAVRRTDLGTSWLIRLLFRVRGLPRSALHLNGLISLGFIPLIDLPDRELLLGIVGKFWTPSGSLVRVAPHDFTSFEEDGYAKAALAIAIRPIAAEETEVVTETRVKTYGQSARLKFRLYWSVIAPFSRLIRREMLRLIRVHASSVSEGESA